MVLLHLRAAVKNDLKYAHFELAFGTLPVLPGTILPRNELVMEPEIFAHAFQTVNFPDPTQPRWHKADRVRNVKFEFSKSNQVLVKREVKRPLETTYTGPHQIISKHDRSFKVKMNREEKIIWLERLKPYAPWRDPYLM